MDATWMDGWTDGRMDGWMKKVWMECKRGLESPKINARMPAPGGVDMELLTNTLETYVKEVDMNRGQFGGGAYTS